MLLWNLFRLKGTAYLLSLFAVLLCDAVDLLQLIF